MNRRSKIAVIGVGFLLVFAAGTIAFYAYIVLRPMYVYHEIGRNINVNSEWTELTPSSTMKIKRRFQAVTLVVDHAQYNGKTKELFFRDGTTVIPELQISDVQGNWYQLEGGSYSTGKFDDETSTFREVSASFSARNPDLPSNGEFRTIRIRSNRPFICAKVIWRNYDLK